MPLTGLQIESALLTAGAVDWSGAAWPLWCRATGKAISVWATIPANVRLTGITAGAAGAGWVQGLLTVPPNPAGYTAAFAATGIQGQTAPSLATVVSTAISTSMTGVSYQGPSIGVAVGTDVSKVVLASSSPLEALLLSTWAAMFGGSGGKATELARGLSIGVAAQMMLGTGMGAVTAPVAGGAPVSGTSPQGSVL